ncbi:hypothetical protein ACN47E_000015 [Coniothyrium glycines]
MLLDMIRPSHEHSPPDQAGSSASNGFFLSQMPLSLIGLYLGQHPPSPSSASPSSATASPPANHVDHSEMPHGPAPQRHVTTNGDGAATPTPTLSRSASFGSSAAGDRPRKRISRSKTSYLLARPAQRINPRPKVFVRPRVLLQLHQVIAAQRPKPVYELIPLSLCPPRSTRRLARTFNTKDRLGPNDFLVVEAEAYTDEDAKKSDEERWAAREVIGVMSSGKGEKGALSNAEICMNDGMSRWVITEMANGGFEFNTTDDHGLGVKARWVPKPAYSRRVSDMLSDIPTSPMFAPGQQDDYRYTFSTINPNSRRHPIIATMTRTRIDILDHYAIPSATSPSTPGHPSYPQSPVTTLSSIDMESFVQKTSPPIETGDALRRLIVVSGIWVSARISCLYDTHGQPSTPTLNTSGTPRPSSDRTVSAPLFGATSRSASPASTLDDTNHSVPKLFRAVSGILPRSLSFSEPPPSPASTRTVPNASIVHKTPPQRARSVGATQLHSMTGSVKGRSSFAFGDEILIESEEERQMKRSEELARIRELALPDPLERLPMRKGRAEDPVGQVRAITPPPIAIQPDSEAHSHASPPCSAPLSSPLPVPADSKRAMSTQSAYNPVSTAGMWDSGVYEGTGLKRRPTSMLVQSERKRKEEKKSMRTKSKETMRAETAARQNNNECFGWKRRGDWYKYKIKLHLKGLFHKGSQNG